MIDLTSDNEGEGRGEEKAKQAQGEETGTGLNAAALEKQAGEMVNQLSTWGNSLWGGFRKQVSGGE